MSGEHGEQFRADGLGVVDSGNVTVAAVVTSEGATRIAACLNALDGVTTEAIEAGAVTQAVQALRSVKDRLDYLQNLWGKEGVTNRVVEMIDAALKPFAEVHRVE